MSLTNPNALVTEERLAEFYQTILPYLGGMPDILANKFAKRDLYSTDEKMIGRWIDGKPLYQKVIPITVDTSIATNSWTALTNLGVTSVRTISLQGVWLESDLQNGYSSDLICLFMNGSTGAITAKSKTGATYTVKAGSCVIAIYTKTSDSAVYIGDDIDYSTEEKIIGTWIDGKPLYQKVYSGLSISVSASSWTTLVNNLNDISSLIQAVGYAYSGTLIMGFKEAEYNSNTNAVNAIAITSRTLNTLVLRYTKSS